MKRFITLVALVTLFAAPALAADFYEGPTRTVLAESGVAEFTADGNCVVWRTDAAAATCGTDLTTELYFPVDVFITDFGTSLYLAGDAGFECDFQLKVAGTAVGTAIDQATATTIGTANVSARQDILVTAGQAIEVVVTAGAGGCNQTTTDPKYTVTVFGHPVN